MFISLTEFFVLKIQFLIILILPTDLGITHNVAAGEDSEGEWIIEDDKKVAEETPEEIGKEEKVFLEESEGSVEVQPGIVPEPEIEKEEIVEPEPITKPVQEIFEQALTEEPKQDLLEEILNKELKDTDEPQSHLEEDDSEMISDLEDNMASQLNPDVKEFIPVSSQSPFENGNGLVANPLLDYGFNDIMVSQSPRKGDQNPEKNLENITIPSERDQAATSSVNNNVHLRNNVNNRDQQKVAPGKDQKKMLELKSESIQPESKSLDMFSMMKADGEFF